MGKKGDRFSNIHPPPLPSAPGVKGACTTEHPLLHFCITDIGLTLKVSTA